MMRKKSNMKQQKGITRQAQLNNSNSNEAAKETANQDLACVAWQFKQFYREQALSQAPTA